MGRNRRISRTLLAGCSLVALIGSSAIATAQDAVSVTDLGRVGTTEGTAPASVAPSSTGDRAAAKEQKKEAPNVIEVQPYTEIEKLPDLNVAEALQRVPGISLESDTGRGRFINIRGLDADQNGTSYDGVILTPSNQASPLGASRAVAFDAFPAGSIGGIEVIKSLTPDMDATGLGGVVNLLPRSLPADGSPFVDAKLGLGWQSLRRSAQVEGDITAGTSFGLSSDTAPWNVDGPPDDRPFSFVGTFTRNDFDRGIDDAEESYSDTAGVPNKALQNLQLRRYVYHDSMQGGAANFTYKPNDLNNFYLRILDTGYEEQVDKHFLTVTGIDGQTSGGTLVQLPNGTYQATNATAHQQFTNDDEDIENQLFAVGGHSFIADTVKLDYRASWTRGTDAMPNSQFSDFVNPNPVTVNYNNQNPNAITLQPVGVDLRNPGLYTLNSLRSTPFQDSDQEYAFAVDATVATPLAGYDGESKFGFSARLRTRGTSTNQTTLGPAGTTNLANLVSGPNDIYYTGLYNLGPNIVNQALNASGLVPTDPAGDLIANQEAFSHDDEDVYAGYGQYSTTIGQLHLLGGVRVEGTDATYKANLGTTDPTGTITTITPTSTSTGYVNVFPSIHAKYDITDDLIARAAISTAIARPGFNQISAAKTIDFSQGTISQGNSSLKPATDTNFDLSLEYYLPRGGILSFGAFDKEYDNYIVPTSVFVDNFDGTGLTFQSSTFKNISGSQVQGLEFQYTQQFTFLPAPLDGFGFDGNYTYNHSRGQIRSGEYEPLPSTSPQNFNAALFYEDGPITTRLASSFVSRNLFSVGSNRNTDVFSNPRFRLDFQASYDLTKNLSASFAVHNITNTKLEFTESEVASRPIQREFYDSDYLFSLRLKI